MELVSFVLNETQIKYNVGYYCDKLELNLRRGY